MDGIPRRSSPTPGPRPAAPRAAERRRAVCRPCRATAWARRRTAATPGSATGRGAAPRSPPASATAAWSRARDRGAPGTARTRPPARARAPRRRRGRPAAGGGHPVAAPASTSRRQLDRGRRRTLAGGPDLGLVGGVDGIAVLRPRERAGAHVAGVVAEGALDLRADLGVAPDEARGDVSHEVAQDIVGDHELAVHARPRADAIHQHTRTLADERRGLRRDCFEQNREHAGPLQCFGIANQALRGRERLSLHPVAAELAEALWCEA